MRLLLLLALALPATAADSPTVEQALAYYGALGWVHVTHGTTELVCLPRAKEPNLDMVVAFLAHRARSVCS
jgi:hypothetical protein